MDAASSSQLPEERLLPEYVLQYRSMWTIRYRIWNTAYYILAIGSALLATLAAAGWKEKIQPIRSSLFVICLASAGFSSVLTVLNPKAKAEAYRNALKILESAVLKYESDSAISVQDLFKAVSTANDCFN
jgi:hypothetical protein